MDRGAWWPIVHRVTKESDTTERLRVRMCTHARTRAHTHTHTHPTLSIYLLQIDASDRMTAWLLPLALCLAIIF